MENLDDLKRSKSILMPFSSSDFYSAFFQSGETSSSSLSNNNEISHLLIDVKKQYGKNLTSFQLYHIAKIFESFSYIQDEIEPERLTSFSYYFNEDDEFLIYRKSRIGLTNIIIHDEECIAFSFIGRNTGDRDLIFYEEGEIDYEKLAYKFFAK